jgi:hypothetical protein
MRQHEAGRQRVDVLHFPSGKTVRALNALIIGYACKSGLSVGFCDTTSASGSSRLHTSHAEGISSHRFDPTPRRGTIWSYAQRHPSHD